MVCSSQRHQHTQSDTLSCDNALSTCKQHQGSLASEDIKRNRKEKGGASTGDGIGGIGKIGKGGMGVMLGGIGVVLGGMGVVLGGMGVVLGGIGVLFGGMGMVF